MRHASTLPVAASLLFLALSGVPVGAQVGSVLRAQRIDEGHGGFSGALDVDDQLGGHGNSIAFLGDLDGDGIGDLAVGAPGDDDGGTDRGAIWILFLAADGTVQSETKVSQTAGGFGGALVDSGFFGRRVANVGDLDADGVPELMTLSGIPNRIWVLFLNPDGTVKAETETLFSDPAFVPATTAGSFSNAGLCALGDLDGDGLGDVALGAPRDDGGARDAGAVWIVRLDAVGGVKSAHRIGAGTGGFTGVLEEGDQFGSALVQLGDLDGDGNRELGVGSPFGSVLGDFWILYLDASETVSSQTELGIQDYGLAWPSGVTLGTADEFAWLGDLDGDGVGELALEFAGHDFPGGAEAEGGIAIAFLRSDGTVRKKTRISHQRGGFGDLPRGTSFGAALFPLGDLDGDGAPELAVGAPTHRNGGERTGGLWILSLDPDAFRNGSGANPATLTQVADPVFGTPWTATLDCSGHAPGLAVLWGRAQRLAGTPSAFGEILVGGPAYFQLVALHASGSTPLTANVPPFEIALIDLPIFAQGLCTGAPGPQLSNALDVLVGQ